MVMLARVCGIKWQDGWISHELEGFVSMQSWPNQGTIPAFAWRDWGRPQKT
jgi:hypothetical protein